MVMRVIAEDLKDLIRSGKKYKRSKGQVIQSTEDQRNINYIDSGYIKRYMIANDGSLGVQVVFGPHDIFPATFAFKNIFQQDISHSSEVFYYEAMTDCVIYAIGIDRLLDELKKRPDLYKDLYLETGKRLYSTLNGLENLTLKSSYKRVAHQIYYFAYLFGETTKRGIKILLPLTHQDIADILSLTRETVSMSMVELKKKKLIIPGRNTVVPNMEKLKDEAYN